MCVEVELRRPEFLGGIPVHLADGGEWAFPGPRELVHDGAVSDPRLARLLVAVFGAEDEAERGGIELALAIHLLALNYRLGPEDYDLLLDGHGTAGAGADLRHAFHDLSVRFADALLPRPAVPEAVPAQGRRFRFPRFLPARLAARLTAERAVG
jgi:hypothetical protein